MRFIIPLLLLPVLAFGHDSRSHLPYKSPSPLDVCVSRATGEIAIADTDKMEVAIVSPDWKPLREINFFEKDGKPVSLALTPGDDLVLLMSGNDPKVVVYSNDGKLLRQFTTNAGQKKLSDPQGVAVDDSGNVFVFDSGNHRVVVFDKNGKFIFEFSNYTWNRDFEGKTEAVTDHLQTPNRGDFLPDGRLIISDYDGPVVNPKTGQRAGRFSVWSVDVARHNAKFEQWAFPTVPYETSKAGDVVVDRKTGEVFYCDVDFPLTDRDWLKRSSAIGVDPDVEHELYDLTRMTRPSGLAIGKNGEIIVAEAEAHEAYAIPRKIFNKDYNQFWPRRQRLVDSTQNSVTIEYSTVLSMPTNVDIGPTEATKHGEMPKGVTQRMGEVYNADGVIQKDLGARGERHRITLGGLQPGKRYPYRYMVTDRAYPNALFSQVLLATTKPPVGKTQYTDTRLIVLLFTNCYDPQSGVAPPGPMTAEEIEGVKNRLEVGRMFYWVNSGCHLNLKFDYVIVDKQFEGLPVERYGYWPEDDHHKIDDILEEKGIDHTDCSALICIYGQRHWDPNAKKWVLSAPGGGNTWGSTHDGSSITTISAGGDTTWLLVHEHGHGIDADYHYSGQIYHFNHFHWNYFPERYGSHFDGNKTIARAFKDLEYWSNVYGKLVVVDDKDNDGVPDDDANCPMDEKRFGSDPTKLDTDSDGLNDLDELMAYDGAGDYPGFNLKPVAPYYFPDPKSSDTDKDGITDGEDRYPLYPVDPAIYKQPINLDGKVTTGEYSKGFNRIMADPDLQGSVKVAYTNDYLVFAVTQKAQDYKLPASLYIELDANDDGMTVGADNQEIHVKPLENGVCDVSTYFNDTIVRMKPVWTNRTLPSPQDCFARWTKIGDEYQLEFAIPKTPEAGIYLNKWRKMGVLIQIKPDGKPERRLFQLQEMLELTLN